MTTPACIRTAPGGVVLSVKAQPRASRNEVVGLVGYDLKIRITAPPVENAANEAILDFLATTLSLPPRQISLLRGKSSRQKLFLIQGLAANDVARCLGL